ncbi:hypothetical protein A7U60_g4094 [Sanghuangporus baumii]|uniref:Uncharacterized protein n=1 Tax=Sanghuangporus baumii TaxID=108892 RepID=A0A9Q5N9E9_SANBA|nr:hypothetical protein A7U60_g4094 [Sanghuangporus baumii]
MSSLRQELSLQSLPLASTSTFPPCLLATPLSYTFLQTNHKIQSYTRATRTQPSLNETKHINMRSYYVFTACVFALLQTGLPALAAPPQPSKPSAVNVATAAAASHAPQVPRAGPLGILPGVGSSNSTSSGDGTTATSTVTSTITETITTTTITTVSKTSTATGSAVTTANGAALVFPIKRQDSPTIPVIQG